MKRLSLHLVLLLFFLIHCVAGRAQQRTLHLGLEQGMTNGKVFDMSQDKLGRVWMATEGGLHCWDGYRFTVYDTKNSGIANNELNTVLADHDGVHVWVGTRRDGLCRLDTRTGEWTVLTREDGLLSNGVTRLHHASDGGIWVAYYLRGIDHMAPDGKLTHYWTENIPGLEPPNWTAVDDGQGHLYIGHVAAGLSVVDLKTCSLKNYRRTDAPHDPTTQPLGNDIFDICWDNDGLLWTATLSGVSVFSPREGKFVRHVNLPSRVSSLLRRHNGEMVVGEEGRGELSLMEDREGNLWRADGQHGVNVECHERPLFQHADTAMQSVSMPGLSSIVHDTCHVGTNVLIGTMDGLWQRDANGRLTERTDINSQMEVLIIHSLTTDRQGKLWIGTFGDGLYVFTQDGRLVSHQYEPSADVNMVMCDSRGRMWVAHHHGLSRYDDTRHPDSLRLYDRPEQLRNTLLMSVCEDRNGHIWTSGNGGIACLDPESDRWQNYTYADGIPYSAFQERQAALLPDGRLAFGQEQGACVFEPEYVEQKRTLPSIFVSSLVLFRQNEETGAEETVCVPFIDGQDLVFAHDENSLQVTFSVDDVSKAEAVNMQYRLLGSDDKWYDIGIERMLTLHGLDPGHYQLQVRARIGGAGEWSEELITLPITVRQPWWWTWWMRLLYVALAAAFLWYLWRSYQQRQQLRRRLAERLAAMYAQPSASSPETPVTDSSSETGTSGTTPTQEEEKKELNRIDREFLARLDDIILTHLTEPQLDVRLLTTEMAMSHSTLYRRLKDLTGMSANEYVRRHRLAKGMQLLRDGYNVSEVSDRCGFSSAKYFSRCFKDEYGVSPSEV